MIKGMNHVGISVASLDRSIRFYRDVLGMEMISQRTFEGGQYEAILALGGASGRVALLKAQNMQLELFEFSRPAPAPGVPNRPVCDHGITHFCVEVSDVEGEYERMKSAGVVFHCPPVEFFCAAKAAYARDPDGNAFELLELLPNGRL